MTAYPVRLRPDTAPLRTFVLDTSVLLSDPGALARFGKHEIVLPVVVISELEAKRHHPELGWFARQTLRVLDDLRIRHGRLDDGVPIGDEGGLLHVELNHSDIGTLPAGFRVDSNDSRILAVAANLVRRGPARHAWSPRTCRCASRPPASVSTPTSTAPTPLSTPAGPV